MVGAFGWFFTCFFFGLLIGCPSWPCCGWLCIQSWHYICNIIYVILACKECRRMHMPHFYIASLLTFYLASDMSSGLEPDVLICSWENACQQHVETKWLRTFTPQQPRVCFILLNMCDYKECFSTRQCFSLESCLQRWSRSVFAPVSWSISKQKRGSNISTRGAQKAQSLGAQATPVPWPIGGPHSKMLKAPINMVL